MKLYKEEKEMCVQKIQQYFLEERDEEVGELAVMLLVEYVSKELGPIFYNKGIEDAHNFLEEKIEDIYGLKKIVRK